MPSRARPGQHRWAGGWLARRAAIAAAAAAALPVAAGLASFSPASAATGSPQAVMSPVATPTNCVPDVGVCGYPDAETSGVPG